MAIITRNASKMIIYLGNKNRYLEDKSSDRNVPNPYEDLHDSVGRFDFVLALPSAAARSLTRSHAADRPKKRINPPFNVSKIDKERLAGDPRYPFGIFPPPSKNRSAP